jgi:hypothetical protein
MNFSFIARATRWLQIIIMWLVPGSRFSNTSNSTSRELRGKKRSRILTQIFQSRGGSRKNEKGALLH